MVIMKRKILLTLIGLCCIVVASKAQITVVATAGVPFAPYSSLTAAFAAINAGTHQGMIGIGISASYVEPGTAVLNSSGAGPAVYQSVRISPTVDGVVVTCATATGRGIIELNGADSVIIDGDNPNTGGTNRNLTIQNTAINTTTFTSCIRLATSTLITNCNNVTIRNLNLFGSGTNQNTAAVTSEVITWGIIGSAGASTVLATNAPGALASGTTTQTGVQTCTNLIVDNNNIQSCSRGVSLNGAAAAIYVGSIVSNNLIGNATPGATDQVTGVGITMNGTNNGIIRGNTVRIESFLATSTPNRAINVGMVSTTGLTNVLIEKNIIERSINHNSGTYNAFGIDVVGGSNHLIRNNFVGDCLNDQTAGTGAFSTTFGAFGIRIQAGAGHQIQYNTVHFTGNVPGTISSNLVACLGIVTTGSTGMDIRNNVFSNNATGGNPTLYNTVLVSVYLPSGATSAMNLNWNNNVYYTGTTTRHGIAQVSTTGNAANLYLAANFNAGATAPVTNFRSYTSTLNVAGTNDNASLASTATPPLISGTNLHVNLGAPNATDLNATAAVIAGITTDIDGDIRDVATPDKGADEFILVVCSSADGGTISPATYTRCAGQTVVLNSTGTSSGIGTSYQWMVSNTPGGPYSNVSGGSGATTSTYTSGALIAGTYYYVLQATCSFGPIVDLSNEVTVTVNALPIIGATPASSTYCNPGPGVVLTASGGVGYLWSPGASLSGTIGSPVTATPTVATTYTVTGTDVNGCTGTATALVNVGATPAGTATANPVAVCNNGNSMLIGSGLLAAPTGYCQPNNSTGCGFPDIITNVVFAGISTSNACDNLGGGGYSFFAAPTGSITAGTTIPYSVSTGGDIEGAAMWIDYNHDGTFAASEMIFNGLAGTNPATYSGTTLIPLTAINGATRMRVRCTYNANPNGLASPPCTGVTYGETEDYIVNISGGASDPSLTYVWSPGTFLNTTTNDTALASNITATTTYTVTITNGGCSSTASATITAGSALTSSPITTNSPVCEGSNITSTALPSGGGAPYTYKWNYGGGQFTTPTANLSINTIPAGSYTLTSAVLDACGDSTTQTTPFTINPRPTVGVTTSGGTSVCPGSTLTLTGNGATTYTWSPATYLSATSGTNVDVSGTVAGYVTVNYLAIGTDANGCQDSAMQTVTLATQHYLTATSSAPNVCVAGLVNLSVADTVLGSGPLTQPVGYCAAAASLCDEAVNAFTFGAISTTSGCSGSYADNTAMSTTVLVGNIYPVSVTTTLYYSGDQANVWIDWNRDGDFVDASENNSIPYSGTGGVFNGNITVPAFAQAGATRMRVRMNYTGTPSPCGSPTFGEVEDYTVMIQAMVPATGSNTYTWNPVTTPPTGMNVSDNPVVSTNYIVTATDSIGCNAMDSVFVNVDAVVASLAPIDITCNGANDGSFSMTGYTCGTPGFAFSVDGGSFGPIPTNLTPGSHSVIVRDTIGGLSSPININITQPSWTVPSPAVTNAIICVGDPSAILTGSVAIADTVTIVVPFNVTVQPTETNFAPGNAVGTGTVPSIPAGSNIISAVLSYPNLNTVGFSYNADVNLGFSGSVTDAAAPDPSAIFTAGLFNYTRSIPVASINTAGGTATLLYWDDFDDNFGSDETMFPTGATAATLTIKYLPVANISWWTAPTAGTNLANNDSLESVGTSVLPNTNTSGVYNFYAEAEYSGCYSSSRSLSTVTVGSYPVVNLGPDSSYCVTHTLDAGNPGLTYVWNDGSTTQTITALDTGIYWVDVTSAFGCTTRDSIMLTINPLPVVDLGPDTSSCGSYLLDPGPQYPGSMFLWNDLSSNPTLLTTSSGDFNVTVTDVNGCSNADTVTVNVPPITYNNLGPDTMLCTNANGFTLDATTVGVTYEWQDGSTNPTFFVNLPGTYWCTITNFVGCTFTDTVIVTSVNPVQTNINVNFVTTTSATLDAGSGFSSYLWSTSGSTQVITVNTNGTYYVEVMDANNCITTDTVSIIFSLGVFNPNGTATSMKLYPNPSEGVFNVAIDNLETSDLVMEILDMNGKVVYNKYVGSVSGSTIEPFNLTTLRVGTYTLRLTANGKSSSLRFIINK
jgi:hypothetical protein